MEVIYYNCPFCNYRTKRKYDLKRHYKSKHDDINPVCDNRTIIFNNSQNTTFNKTRNINIIRFKDEDVRIDINIDHLGYTFIDLLYSLDVKKAYSLFYKKLFQSKYNQNIIKINLKQFFLSDYTSPDIYKQKVHDDIYFILLFCISETLLTYIYDNTKDKEDIKYKELKEYATIMGENKYHNNITKKIEKSYNYHIKSLKSLFDKFKDD
jgi:hypothetical protein